MFRYLIFALLLISSAQYAFGQAEGAGCPKINIVGPGGNVMAGDTMTFTANIPDYDQENVRYRWSLSRGVVLRGLYTSSVNVRTVEDFDGDYVATVEIEGLPEGCTATASETATIQSNCGHPAILDEYEQMSSEQERVRLKAIVEKQKSRGDKSRLFLVLRGGKTRDRIRIDAISSYLISLGLDATDFFVTQSAVLLRTRIYLVSEKCVRTSSEPTLK